MIHVIFLILTTIKICAFDSNSSNTKSAVCDFYDRNIQKYEAAEQYDTDNIATSVSSNYLSDDKNITLGLIKRIGEISNLSGLDCGCGPFATDMKIFSSFGYEMSGFDGSNEAITRNIQNNPELFNNDNMRHIILPSTFPYQDKQFDFVQIRAVIQHLSKWSDVIKVFHEIDRVLRPGGIFSLIFKHGAHESNLTVFDRNYGEYRTFTLYDVNTILSYLINESEYVLIEKSSIDGLGGIMYYTNHQPVSHCIMWFKKKMSNILQIYNLAVDTNINLNDNYYHYNHPLQYQGGGGLYSSCTASLLGCNMHLFSKNREKDHSFFDVIKNQDSLHIIKSDDTTFCHNIFIKNKRFTYIPIVSPAFTLDDINNHIINQFDSAEINMVVFSGLHNFEFPWKYYELVTNKYNKSIVIIDGQALFRNIEKDSSTSTELSTFNEYLSSNNTFIDSVDLLKIGISEINSLHNNDYKVRNNGFYFDAVDDQSFKDWIADGVNILFNKYTMMKSVLITTPKYLIYCYLDRSCYYQKFMNGHDIKQNGRGDTALLAFSINYYLYHKNIKKSLLLTKHYIEYAMQQSTPVCNRLYH